jgi:hypothetical protein
MPLAVRRASMLPIIPMPPPLHAAALFFRIMPLLAWFPKLADHGLRYCRGMKNLHERMVLRRIRSFS